MNDDPVLRMDQQSRKPSITIGGNVPESKRIMLLGTTQIYPLEASVKLIMSVAGVSMIQTCHQIQMTHEDNLPEPGRQRARESVTRTLFRIFRTPKPHYQSLTTIEDVEVRSQTHFTPFSSLEGKVLLKKPAIS